MNKTDLDKLVFRLSEVLQQAESGEPYMIRRVDVRRCLRVVSAMSRLQELTAILGPVSLCRELTTCSSIVDMIEGWEAGK